MLFCCWYTDLVFFFFLFSSSVSIYLKILHFSVICFCFSFFFWRKKIIRSKIVCLLSQRQLSIFNVFKLLAMDCDSVHNYLFTSENQKRHVIVSNAYQAITLLLIFPPSSLTALTTTETWYAHINGTDAEAFV